MQSPRDARNGSVFRGGIRYALKMRSPQPINTPFTRRALLGAAPALFLAACSNPSGGQSQSGTASVTPSVTPTPSPTPVLDAQQLQDLKTQLDKLFQERTYPAHSMLVTALDGTRELYADAPDTPRLPASNMKILTYFALVQTAPERTFTTSVAQGKNGLFLVAGGDTLLVEGATEPATADSPTMRAGLSTLAADTVQQMNERKVAHGTFPVYLDTTIYTGSATNPGWEPGDLESGQITPINPIALASHTVPGQSTPDKPARPQDAGVAALEAFVKVLNKASEEHAEVKSGYVFTVADRRPREADTEQIAQIQSASALDQAFVMMLESDNVLAEVLGRNMAIAAGREGSASEAQKLVREKLQEAKISVTGLVQADVSGMSLQNRVTARTLAQTLVALAAHPKHEELERRFPVAGVSGTLKDRFSGEANKYARGHVAAKTGTLFTAISLSGYATRPDGTRLIFVSLLNDVGGAEALPGAKDTVDSAAAIVAARTEPPANPTETPAPSGSQVPGSSSSPDATGSGSAPNSSQAPGGSPSASPAGSSVPQEDAPSQAAEQNPAEVPSSQ